MVTRVEIKADAKERVDLTDSDHLNDTVVNDWINYAIRDLWSFVYRSKKSALVTSADDTIAAASTNYMSLPAGFRSMVGVERDPASTSRRWLESVNIMAKNQVDRLSYFLTNNRVYVVMPEWSVGSYRIWHIASPTVLSADGTAVDSTLEPWAQKWCALYIAKMARIKEEAATREIEDQIAEMRKDVAAELALRDGELAKGPIDLEAEPVDPLEYVP